MTRRGRWRRRAALSMLAGGGLGAAGLVGPVAAIGVETATTTTSSGAETPPPVTETTPQAPAPEPSKGTQPPAEQPTTTTSTPSAPAGSGGGEGASGTGTSTGTTPTTPTTSASPTPTPTGSQPQGEGSTSAPTVVVQRKQQTTRGGHSPKHTTSTGSTPAQGTNPQEGEKGTKGSHHGPATVPPGTPNGVAPAPQAVGGEAGALAALLANSAVSAQALNFYRVPLFLLPIYQAAAVQYDVPWQILAAINEVETDFGADQSVSTAGAVGWMQFMPATWLQYGVDATDAGYADPYNPVDAIFAAARYLHAAGASRNVRRAVFAYNHSQAYVESVMLRARLIASYPSAVIGTLTGLVDGRLPTVGAHAAPGAVYPPAPSAAGSGTEGAPAETPSSAVPVAPAPSVAGAVATGTGVNATGAGGSSATAGAVPASPLVAGTTTPNGSAAGSTAHGHASAGAAATAQLPGSTPPPPPLVVARRAEAAADAAASPSQLMELSGTPGAAVVAVEDGRVVHLGHSHALGRYLVLRDVYGDIFTYAGLGSIAPRYRRPTPPADVVAQHTPGSAAHTAAGAGGSGAGTGGGSGSGTGSGGVGTGGASGTGPGEAAAEPAPTLPASAGHQRPTTLSVKGTAHSAASAPPPEPEAEAETAAGGMGKVRLYAHPHNPLARAAAARARAHANSGRWLPLRTGSLVTQGTVLGHLAATPAPEAGKLRFAVRPAGDNGTVDPRALLDNWRELTVAMHPRGSKGRLELLGATVQEVFAMSKSELQRSVLSDPGIGLDACGRRDVQEGAVDRRVLGTLEFLSRSGLQPTVGALRCARGRTTAAGPVFEHFAGGWVDIVAINGIPIAGHQGPRSITDATIRALLTLHGQWLPSRIYSLMEYPHAPNTLAHTADWNRIRLAFGSRTASARGAHASAARRSLVPVAAGGSLSRAQWDRLISRIAAIPQPKVASAPSSSAIRDPQAAPTNRALGG